MNTKASDLMLTAVAPAVWGSTYIVTTEFLPEFSPMTVALLRALPAGLLLLAVVRRLPRGIWWLRAFVLGALNISIFLTLLFVSAYRLPGGVAATVASVQPLIVVFLASALLGAPVRLLSVVAALVGMGGVALLVLAPDAALDPVGIAAGLAGAACMALGNVLSRKWQPPVSMLAYTAWQLTAGGLLLIPVVAVFEPALPVPTTANLIGLGWLGLVGAALTYALWFRGLARLESSVVSSLLFLSPLTAVLLGWVFLNQALNTPQIAGVLLVIGSIWLSRRATGRGGAPARGPRVRRASRTW
ncbi:EamA family transporter [Allopusillimonas soli]|uniref:EamA family transporter n=1 Tax=Allopusillimonas soli TaxID=659016 RepID=A0A853FEG1_9BURK|nr:EamA family transporter [Allopusillimonas soli]NYT37210.1 EamA family transporter [Allopusillimonas soli]TEA74787.1 EamA family transporter [Allopusillimonas soli]